MRAFIAIEIPQDIRDELARVIGQLKDSIVARSGEMKWVKPGAIHLTLKFLGDIKEDKIETACSIVKEIISKYEHFQVELSGIGTFASPPKVIWIGIKDEDEILKQIADELDSALCKIGLEKSTRKFRPHLTLCRIKSLKAGQNTEDVMPEFEDYQGPDLPVETVCLYHSRLTDKGAVYTAVCKTELK